MPVVFYSNGATTVPIDTGQWYVTTNTTWATNVTSGTTMDYVDVVQMDGTRWRTSSESGPDPVPEPRGYIPELTPEQRAEQERQRQEARERRETRKQQQREANEAAKQLLLSLLSPENQRRLEARTTIRITGSNGGAYEIETAGGATGNIIRRSAGVDHLRIPGSYRGRLCCHPRLSLPEGQLPHYDAIASQVLMISSMNLRSYHLPTSTANTHRLFASTRFGHSARPRLTETKGVSLAPRMDFRHPVDQSQSIRL